MWPKAKGSLFPVVSIFRLKETWCSCWTYNTRNYFCIKNSLLIKQLKLSFYVILKAKHLPISLSDLIPRLYLVIPSFIQFGCLYSSQILSKKIDSQIALFHPHTSLFQINISISKRHRQQNFLFNVLRLEWKRSFKNILKKEVIFSCWVLLQTHANIGNGFISHPFVRIYYMRGDFSNYEMGSWFSYSEITNGVK